MEFSLQNFSTAATPAQSCQFETTNSSPRSVTGSGAACCLFTCTAAAAAAAVWHIIKHAVTQGCERWVRPGCRLYDRDEQPRRFISICVSSRRISFQRQHPHLCSASPDPKAQSDRVKTNRQHCTEIQRDLICRQRGFSTKKNSDSAPWRQNAKTFSMHDDSHTSRIRFPTQPCEFTSSRSCEFIRRGTATFFCESQFLQKTRDKHNVVSHHSQNNYRLSGCFSPGGKGNTRRRVCA